jgi:hypothetical protein
MIVNERIALFVGAAIPAVGLVRAAAKTRTSGEPLERTQTSTPIHCIQTAVNLSTGTIAIRERRTLQLARLEASRPLSPAGLTPSPPPTNIQRPAGRPWRLEPFTRHWNRLQLARARPADSSLLTAAPSGGHPLPVPFAVSGRQSRR